MLGAVTPSHQPEVLCAMLGRTAAAGVASSKRKLTRTNIDHQAVRHRDNALGEGDGRFVIGSSPMVREARANCFIAAFVRATSPSAEIQVARVKNLQRREADFRRRLTRRLRTPREIAPRIGFVFRLVRGPPRREIALRRSTFLGRACLDCRPPSTTRSVCPGCRPDDWSTNALRRVRKGMQYF